LIALSRFETLLVEEIPALRRYARALCGDLVAADDLVQESLLRAVGRQRLWISHKGMRPWLFTILHNIFVNTLRQEKRSPMIVNSEQVQDSLVSSEDPGELCTISDFEKALQGLSADHREVLLLVAVEQMSYRKVSKITAVPIGTVMSRLSRARSLLRDALEGEIKEVRIKRVK
jgi:RNA polymerase sigma factor (sigma-70 family)